MGVPTSEVGYTLVMPRREDHEVHKGRVVALGGGGETPKTEHGVACLPLTHVASIDHSIG